jgi:hypothetical protein
LTIFNGSPRGEKSNSRILLEQFLAGFTETAGNSYEVYYLVKRGDRDAAVEAFGGAEVALLAFPLYTDAMPGIVKDFIERLAAYKGRSHNPAVLFLVQSGFPEASHTEPISRYLEKLARRLGCHFLGVIRRGGVEGIQVMPPPMTRKLFEAMREFGRGFGRCGRLNQETVRAFAGPARLPKIGLYLNNWMGRITFWNPQLKAHGAYGRRFDKPYAP